ncbi:hypothetical protein AVEN_42984-1 [Araneus ventricosus]|uniref:Uncharacterized protein n=1 Tax=Araneus ventricosus TaxID=182803 RepID=A0A4Y2AFD2_ARAVE|nr:hypothetical protein AVEN_42984-1 [Araneus ventricosus]
MKLAKGYKTYNNRGTSGLRAVFGVISFKADREHYLRALNPGVPVNLGAHRPSQTRDREILGRERSEMGFCLLCTIAALGISICYFSLRKVELPAIYVFLIEESERPFVKG